MRSNYRLNLKHKAANRFCRKAQAAKFRALNLKRRRAMNAMKFTEIYAASAARYDAAGAAATLLAAKLKGRFEP